MISKGNFVELRKHDRVKIKEDAFVELYKPRLFKLGKPPIVKFASIVDIGLGGLAFQYTDPNMWTADLNVLSIANTAEKIKIDRVPFIAVSDFLRSRNSDSTFTRRCGVEFGELTFTQKFQMANFIQNQTITDGRSGIERRQFSYSANSPELRSGKERRGDTRSENYKL